MKAVLPFLAALLLFPSSALSRTWSVFPDGAGDAPTIQAAVDSSAPGDTILLGTGVFTGDGNRDIAVARGGIALVGDAATPEGCVVDCEGTPQRPHRGFVLTGAGGDGVLLQGFMIRGGYTEASGGAIRASGSSLTLRDVYLVGNRALVRGGGACLLSSPATSISGCSVRGNEAEDGGGLWVEGSSLEIEASFIEDNRAGPDENIGGGLGCWESTVTMNGVSFFSNQAGYAAGIFLYNTDAELADCFVKDNVASEGCGGLYSMAIASRSLVVRRSSFARNEALFAAGAAYVSMYQSTFDDCLFHSNTSNYAGAFFLAGFADFLGCRFIENEGRRNGGAFIGDACHADFSDCVFLANAAADSGGAVLAQNNGAVRFASCTLQGNRAATGSGIVVWDYGTLDVDRSIISFGGEGAGVSVGSSAISADFSCSDLFGNEGGDWVGSIAGELGANGNIAADPLYCDATGGDLTLAADSPCLPGNHPDGAPCARIGAFDEGCGGPTHTESTSWSSIKQMFR